MNKSQFEESEFPYEVLSQFGLTSEMIEDLPTRVINDIKDGRRTPVLPVRIFDDDGNDIKSRARFALVRKEDNTVDVLFYPELLKADLSKFDDKQKDLLLSGKSIIATVEDKDGQAITSFVQIDRETNQVLSASVQMIARNLQTISDQIGLSAVEQTSLQKGEVVTFSKDDEYPISVGIDLNDRTGLRFTPGDENQWRDQNKREWDKYTFGAFGCWVVDDNGQFDYVAEDDYTEELWNEQKKQGMKAMQHTR